MKPLYIWSDRPSEYNCSLYRCHVPYFAMRRAGLPCEILHVDQWLRTNPEALRLTKECNPILLQRNSFGPTINEMVYWKGEGKTIVVDLDDGYAQMTADTGSPSFEFWGNGRMEKEREVIRQTPVRQGNRMVMQEVREKRKEKFVVVPSPMQSLTMGVKIAGNVSSPSRVICDDWKDYARTWYIPNYVDLSMYKRHEVFHEPGKIFIGYGGSIGHRKAFAESGIKEALHQITMEYKNVWFLTAGDPNVNDGMDIPPARKVKIGWFPQKLYSKSLSYYDLGLIPLAGEYDRRRSCLKSLEYTLLGVPWIGSNLDPCQEIGTGALVNNTVNDWYNAIKNHIRYLSALKAEMEVMRQAFADKWNIDNNLGALTKTYRKMLKED
jgi:hypothetical protein